MHPRSLGGGGSAAAGPVLVLRAPSQTPQLRLRDDGQQDIGERRLAAGALRGHLEVSSDAAEVPEKGAGGRGGTQVDQQREAVLAHGVDRGALLRAGEGVQGELEKEESQAGQEDTDRVLDGGR